MQFTEQTVSGVDIEGEEMDPEDEASSWVNAVRGKIMDSKKRKATPVSLFPSNCQVCC